MEKIIRYIGIDFGTSTSVVSYLDYKQDITGKLTPCSSLTAVDYSNVQGITAVPTIIKKEDKETGPEKYGCDVPGYIINERPDLLCTEFKMQLGGGASPEERKTAIELMYRFLKYLADGYQNFAGGTESLAGVLERRIFVSYPAKWEIEQKSLTRDAATKAFGRLGVVSEFDEPTAVLFYIINANEINAINTGGGDGQQVKTQLTTVDKVSNILIIDMGAGTTDLVLFQYSPKKPTSILAKYPHPGKDSITFGGREIEEIIYDYLKEYYPEGIEGESRLSVLAESKKWKEDLSKSLSDRRGYTTPNLPFRIRMTEKDGFRMDSQKLLGLLKGYLVKFPGLVNGIIKEAIANNAGFKGAEDIDLVVLTGGHSQWFFIEDMLKGTWVPGLPGNETTGSGITLPKIQKDSWRLLKTTRPQQIVSFGLSLSGIKPELIYLSNSNVQLEITFGEGYANMIKVLSRNQRLPVNYNETKIYNCKIKREDKRIPIKITPIIGDKDRLDTIYTTIDTNIFTDWANNITDLFKRGFELHVDQYRTDEINFRIQADFDVNMILSLKGSLSTGDFGDTKAFNLDATDIARIIKESLK